MGPACTSLFHATVYSLQPLLPCWCLFGKGEGGRKGWEVQCIFLKLREASWTLGLALLSSIRDVSLGAKFMTSLTENKNPG